jgi:predicted RNA-binding Zn ribbon-like protein
MDITQLPLVGGHPALDFANTLDWDAAGRDYLESTEDLATWSRRTALTSPADIPAAPSDRGAAAILIRVRGLRAALRTILLAQLNEVPWDDPNVATALSLVSERAAAAATRTRLIPGRSSQPLSRVVGTESEHLIEDRLASTVIELLTSEELARLHRCPINQGGCGWMFLDRSKNSSRTWCRMEDCGNQAKARRLTERRRSERAAKRSALSP